jgi:hypothetical protein
LVVAIRDHLLSRPETVWLKRSHSSIYLNRRQEIMFACCLTGPPATSCLITRLLAQDELIA